MLAIAALCGGLLAALPDVDATAPDPAAYEAAYREARTKVGRDPDAHVRLALWCESHGLDAERLKHLAIAALIDPGHASARGLMGLVSHAGRWTRPDAVAEQLQADPARAALLEEYRARRDRTPLKPEEQWKLALWCEQNGLEAEAEAHLTIVTRLDPDHAAARKRLGYKKQRGRWVTDAQLAREKAEAELQKKADRAWKPRLEKLREQLAGKDEAKRTEAERALREVTDPRAVPAVFAVFGAGSRERQSIAVQVLGQIEGPVASHALLSLAVFSPAAEVRRDAIQTLARRDPRDFAGLLVDRLRDPIKYEVRPVEGPGSPGVLFVEGEKFDVRRTYGTPALHPNAGLPRFFTPDTPFDPFSDHTRYMASGAATASRGIVDVGQIMLRQSLGSMGSTPVPMSPSVSAQAAQSIAANPLQAPSILARQLADQSQGKGPLTAPRPLGNGYVEPVRDQSGNVPFTEIAAQLQAMAYQRDYELGLIALDMQRATIEAQGRLSHDLRALDMANAAIHEANGRILPVLEGVSGRAYGEDHSAWRAWWAEQSGFGLPPEGNAYKPVIDQVEEVPFVAIPIARIELIGPSCFGAGTAVRTRDASVPIESVKVGDLVLAQDVCTGALDYRPVVAVFHNPPTKPLKVTLGGESIVATGIHRFWKVGHGWVMARELEAGDTLRTLGGMARVSAIEPQEVQPVFNLEVAGLNTFFVGMQGALVHDNNLVQSTPEPFDAVPDVTAVAGAPAASPR